MLRALHISHYILIDSLDIEFPDGLIIVTGQTGAGKSILLGALSLLGGGKADASVISPGASSCVVEAEFELPSDSQQLRELLKENEIECEGNMLTVRRVISSSGRSRSFAGDCPVTVQTLSELISHLVDIHSQHSNILLSDRRFQLSLLDSYAGATGCASECAAAWKKLCALRSERESVREKLDSIRFESDYKQARFEKLRDANLVSGELESLEEEHKALSNAEQIKEALGSALQFWNSDSGSDSAGIASSLRESVRAISRAGRFLPGLEELSQRLESARIELDDVFSEIEDCDARVDLSPSRLEAVEERMSLLYGLLKSFSCSDVDGLIALRDSLSSELSDPAELEERLNALEAEIKSAGAHHASLCDELSRLRSAAAPRLGTEITEMLHGLELSKSLFSVELGPSEPGPAGRDSLRFLFSSGSQSATDVRNCASGGEMSRIMLCLKNVMARFRGMPTMIFDEIDTGVSGSVASAIGEMLRDMGGNMQILAITHLPQVAAKGDSHYVVEKTSDASGRDYSGIRRLEGEQRVLELARLLSGSSVTPEALANAKSLLQGS